MQLHILYAINQLRARRNQLISSLSIIICSSYTVLASLLSCMFSLYTTLFQESTQSFILSVCFVSYFVNTIFRSIDLAQTWNKGNLLQTDRLWCGSLGILPQ